MGREGYVLVFNWIAVKETALFANPAHTHGGTAERRAVGVGCWWLGEDGTRQRCFAEQIGSGAEPA